MRATVAGAAPNGEASASAQSLSRRRRQERIAEYVLDHGSVTVDALVRELDVSRMTVHRELDELERQGVLRKVRGGATAERSRVFESDVQFRLRTAVREKEALADYALSMIEPGQAVMLDASTTVLPLARRLTEREPLTVITNFLAVMRVLAGQHGIRLIATGGDYLARYDAFVGLTCERAIDSVRPDVSFISTSAVGGHDALHQELQIVAVHHAMMRAAHRRVLLIDHGKLGKAALHRVAPLREFDAVVVDAGIPDDVAEDLRAAGVPLHVAPAAP